MIEDTLYILEVTKDRLFLREERLSGYISSNNEQTCLCILILDFHTFKFFHKYHHYREIHHFEAGLPKANITKQCFAIYNIIFKKQVLKASIPVYET